MNYSILNKIIQCRPSKAIPIQNIINSKVQIRSYCCNRAIFNSSIKLDSIFSLRCVVRKLSISAQGRKSTSKGRYNNNQPELHKSHEIEGPIVHHAKQAAVVVTSKDFISQPSHQSAKYSFNEEYNNKLNNSKEEDVHSKELISHTKAFIREVTEIEKENGNEAAYILEQNRSRVTTSSLSGALPPEALDWKPVEVNASQLPSIYASLAKSRLTGLVVATALGGYVLCPNPLVISNLLGVVVGTALISSSANTVNQILETPYDAQMKRTSSRVLVRGKITPHHAALFAGFCGLSGVTLLYGACNPATAALGLSNLFLYTSVYTPSKRMTIANTWIGAVVGAIPPLMGWCACSGTIFGPDAHGAWLLSGILFAWQFPHFNALSWNLRPDYSKAGYRMMCVTNPRLCKVTCLRYSAMLLGIGLAAPLLDVTTWTFAIDSTPLNAYMLYLSYQFYKKGDSKSSRNLFRFSLIHLPAIMILMIISKKYTHDQPSVDQKGVFTQHYLNKISNTPKEDLALSIAANSNTMVR